MPLLDRTSKAQSSSLGLSSVLKLVAVTAAIFFLYTISSHKPTAIMTSPENPQPPTIPIQVTISDISSHVSETSKSPVVNLKITLHNESPDKPISFLRWSSPLDTKSAAMGIFVFTSKSSGNPAPSLNLKLNRKIPDSGVFSSEDTIRIEAGGKVEKELEIKAPEVVLEKGEKYAVSAKGSWTHVLVGDYAELKTDQKGVLRGSFESEALEFEAPS